MYKRASKFQQHVGKIPKAPKRKRKKSALYQAIRSTGSKLKLAPPTVASSFEKCPVCGTFVNTVFLSGHIRDHERRNKNKEKEERKKQKARLLKSVKRKTTIVNDGLFSNDLLEELRKKIKNNRESGHRD